MAQDEHVRLILQGSEVWNAWRQQHPDVVPDLSTADLKHANLRGANLTNANLNLADLAHADFTGAELVAADLVGAFAINANLVDANLTVANLSYAKLNEANLAGANLTSASLTHAGLAGANLRDVTFEETVFADTSLSPTRGLDTCIHRGPSTIDLRTLQRSGQLPLSFLRGCGLRDWKIEFTKLYQQALRQDQIVDVAYETAHIRGEQPIQFYSCFISYSSKDEDFAQRLYADLWSHGVPCWFAPEDMKIGDRIRTRIDEVIHVQEKLLLVLSANSIDSDWVEKEVETAFEKERKTKSTVLFPIRLDDAVMESKTGWAADIKRTRHIGDFRHWKDQGAYSKAFERLLRDLRAPMNRAG